MATASKTGTGENVSPLSSNQKAKKFSKLVQSERSVFHWDSKKRTVEFDYKTEREIEVVPLVNMGPLQYIVTRVDGKSRQEAIMPFVIDPETGKPKTGADGNAEKRQRGMTPEGVPAYHPAELRFVSGEPQTFRVPEDNDIIYALLRDVGNASVQGVRSHEQLGRQRWAFYINDVQQAEAKRKEQESQLEQVLAHSEDVLAMQPIESRNAAIESLEYALGISNEYGNDKMYMRTRAIRSVVENAPEQYKERVMSERYPYYATFYAGLKNDLIVRRNDEYVYYDEAAHKPVALGVTQEESVEELGKASNNSVFVEIKQRTGVKLLTELREKGHANTEPSSSEPQYKKTTEVEHNGKTYKVSQIGEDFYVYKDNGDSVSERWAQFGNIVEKAKASL